jgi:indolepyruvate ferredoxin oxidoreductase beta subunit
MAMSDVRNILLVGVGGQGTILASKILSTGLLGAGYDVKMSEVHGMAQRGGSVSTQVRFGSKVFSPLIGQGEADVLVSFEAMEALRWLDYLKPSGKALVNDYRIPSVPILLGKRDYPADVLDRVKAAVDTTVIDAAGIAAGAGNPRAMNIVLLGALVGAVGLGGVDWEREIAANVKPASVGVNAAAFRAGFAAFGAAAISKAPAAACGAAGSAR